MRLAFLFLAMDMAWRNGLSIFQGGGGRRRRRYGASYARLLSDMLGRTTWATHDERLLKRQAHDIHDLHRYEAELEHGGSMGWDESSSSSSFCLARYFVADG